MFQIKTTYLVVLLWQVSSQRSINIFRAQLAKNMETVIAILDPQELLGHMGTGSIWKPFAEPCSGLTDTTRRSVALKGRAAL